MFVTDGDLKISSNMVMLLTVGGAFLVHEQLHISGNATLSGQIIVEDAANNSTLVTLSTISSNMTLSFNGTLAGAGGALLLTPTAWRDVR